MVYIATKTAVKCITFRLMEGTESKLCTKCGGDLDTKGFPLWCKKCQNVYRKQYYAVLKERAQKNGVAAGMQLMREFLAEQFKKYTIQKFSGPEITYIIQTASNPPLPSEQPPQAS